MPVLPTRIPSGTAESAPLSKPMVLIRSPTCTACAVTFVPISAAMNSGLVIAPSPGGHAAAGREHAHCAGPCRCEGSLSLREPAAKAPVSPAIGRSQGIAFHFARPHVSLNESRERLFRGVVGSSRQREKPNDQP